MVALDASGSPVVAWVESGSDILIEQWDGVTWASRVSLISPNINRISSGAAAVSYLSVASLANGRLVVAWQERTGANATIHAKWDISGWQTLPGGEPTTDPGALAPALAVFGDTINLAWEKDGEIRFRRWAADWGSTAPSADGPNGVSSSATPSRYPTVGTDASGLPIVAWVEVIDGSGYVFAKHWNGSAWDAAGSGSLSAPGLFNVNVGTTYGPNLKVNGNFACLGFFGLLRCATL